MMALARDLAGIPSQGMPVSNLRSIPSNRRSLTQIALRRRIRLVLAVLQRDLRSSEMAQILACAVLGAAVGGAVAALRLGVEVLHGLDFNIVGDAPLSAGVGLDPVRILIVPALGGLLLGGIVYLTRRQRVGDIVDPIEANALYGGRMSLADSSRLTAVTVLSNASGASLGMEAGYTQLGAGFYSTVAQYFRLRREDQRVFVTAGAGAAIAAAFNAPLAGAFYGFELVLGSYMPRALAPVAAAAVSATLTQRLLAGSDQLFSISGTAFLTPWSFVLFGILGVLAAGISILAMQSVTWAERILRRVRIPDWLRPCIGGLLLSGIAFYFPQVLGSGHGAIQHHFEVQLAFLPLVLLLFAKLIASAVSVGSGFRGGLFSSSLFLGGLFGGAFAQAVGFLMPSLYLDYHATQLVGMGSVAAAIVGAPLTMVFLVLESTGDFPSTIGVLTGVIMASTIVRLTFGYSFATWRFHQKGLGIRSAHDVGWIADLTVKRMMRADPKIVPTNMSVRALRQKYPPGSAKRIFAVDPEGHYAGTLDMAIVNDPQLNDGLDDIAVADMIENGHVFLFPGENVRTALDRFNDSQTESLPVVMSRSDPRIVGYLTEAYVLRRYAQELERRRSAELGETDLFALRNSP